MAATSSSLRFPPSLDPARIPLPESPDKRSLRTMKSHSHLPSTQPSLISQQRRGLIVRASREQLNTSTTTPSSHQSLPARTRANSDAPVPFERPTFRKVRNPPVVANNENQIQHQIQNHSRKTSLEVLLRDGPPTHNLATGLSLLRHSILRSPIIAAKDGSSDHRVYIWLALLNVRPLPTEEYLALIHRGKSPAYDKIQDDVFRTLATDTLFKRRVKEAALTRLLNATAWTLHDTRAAPPSSTLSIPTPDTDSAPISVYVQGMNVLSAPFLYTARSESQAYALFTHLITTEIPGYIHPSLAGVHRGLELVDALLAHLHPQLSSHLLVKGLPAKLYAFASVLTLCACTPPLPEVLHLWDFLFAYGPHLNIVCIVAQLLNMQDQLLASASPGKLLRAFPQLDARRVVRTTLDLVKKIPPELYKEVVVHAR